MIVGDDDSCCGSFIPSFIMIIIGPLNMFIVYHQERK